MNKCNFLLASVPRRVWKNKVPTNCMYLYCQYPNIISDCKNSSFGQGKSSKQTFPLEQEGNKTSHDTQMSMSYISLRAINERNSCTFLQRAKLKANYLWRVFIFSWFIPSVYSQTHQVILHNGKEYLWMMLKSSIVCWEGVQILPISNLSKRSLRSGWWPSTELKPMGLT